MKLTSLRLASQSPGIQTHHSEECHEVEQIGSILQETRTWEGMKEAFLSAHAVANSTRGFARQPITKQNGCQNEFLLQLELRVCALLAIGHVCTTWIQPRYIISNFDDRCSPRKGKE